MLGQLNVTNLKIDRNAVRKQFFFSIPPNLEAVFEQKFTDVRLLSG